MQASIARLTQPKAGSQRRGRAAGRAVAPKPRAPKPSKSSSGYAGVGVHTGAMNPYEAYVRLEGKQQGLGRYDTAQTAAHARDLGVIAAHSRKGPALNFPRARYTPFLPRLAELGTAAGGHGPTLAQGVKGLMAEPQVLALLQQPLSEPTTPSLDWPTHQTDQTEPQPALYTEGQTNSPTSAQAALQSGGPQLAAATTPCATALDPSPFPAAQGGCEPPQPPRQGASSTNQAATEKGPVASRSRGGAKGKKAGRAPSSRARKAAPRKGSPKGARAAKSAAQAAAAAAPAAAADPTAAAAAAAAATATTPAALAPMATPLKRSGGRRPRRAAAAKPSASGSGSGSSAPQGSSLAADEAAAGAGPTTPPVGHRAAGRSRKPARPHWSALREAHVSAWHGAAAEAAPATAAALPARRAPKGSKGAAAAEKKPPRAPRSAADKKRAREAELADLSEHGPILEGPPAAVGTPSPAKRARKANPRYSGGEYVTAPNAALREPDEPADIISLADVVAALKEDEAMAEAGRTLDALRASSPATTPGQAPRDAAPQSQAPAAAEPARCSSFGSEQAALLLCLASGQCKGRLL